MDNIFKNKDKEKGPVNKSKSLFYKSVMNTKSADEQNTDDSRMIQMQKMHEIEQEKQRIEAEKNGEKEKQSVITEKQSEVKGSELSSADMSKEEKERIHSTSRDVQGNLKHRAGTDVENKLKAMANLNIRKKFKAALTGYVNVRKSILKSYDTTKGKAGLAVVLTDKQKAALSEAYEVLKAVITEYLNSSEAEAKFGVAKNNLEMVKRTSELIKSDDRSFKLTEYRKTQLESPEEKKESDNLPNLIAQMEKEKQEDKKEKHETQKKEDDKKAADKKEEDMTLEEKRGIYNYEEKTKHVKALMDKKIPVPESNDELVQIRSKYSKSINVIKKDGTAGESYEWDESKVDPVMKEHYDWLFKYYMYNDPTIDIFRKELKPVPAIEFKNYKNQMDIKGMDEAYEAQDPSNCYCCSGTALINQYIAMHKKRNGEENAAITQVVNQHQMRAYKPRIRKYDKSYDLIMDKEGYDNNALSIDEYAGEGKSEFGNIFALGDFVLETLKDNGIEDVMLNRMVMNVPQDGMAAEFNTRVRDNMKAVFAEKINEIISAGGIASVLTVEGGYAHYITVTGIDGDNLQVYNSSGYANKSTTESISSLLQGGVTVEINWLSDMKEPKELTEEYKNLQYDEVNGYSFKTLSSHQINESVSHTKGVTVIKDYKEMGDAYMDISQMAYIPDKKQVESYDFDTYINQAKEEKKQRDKEQVKKDGWEIVDSTVTESKEKEKKADSTAAVSKEKEEKAENKGEEKKANEKKEWTPIANEVLANDQRDYKFKKTEFPKWNFSTSISVNKEKLMGKEKLDELIGPDVIAKTAGEYLAKSANSDYVEKYVKNYPQLKELDSLIDKTYSKALPGKKISSKAHKEVTKDVRKKLAMQRHLLVENQELLKRRNEERALIQNNLKKEGPRSDYTVDIANNFKTDSEKAALGVWLVGGTYNADKTRTGKQVIFQCNIDDTQFDMKCIVEEADLTEFDYKSDSEFIADYAKKYEKLTKLSLVEVFLNRTKYSSKFSKTYLRQKCELAKAIKEEYEERFKLISSPYYALIPQKDLKKYLGKDGEAKIAAIKDKELADYLMLYRSVSNKKALKKTAKYFNSVINRAMEIQKGKDAELSGKPISRIKQGQELAAKLKKNNSALTDDKEENLRLIYRQQIELAKSDEPEKDGDFIEKIALEKEMTLFLGSEGEALHNFEKKIAGFLKNGIYGVPLKEEHKKGLKEQLDKCFKARREYVRHKKAIDIVDELSWSFGCDMVNKKFAETKEGKFLKQFANEGDVPVDMVLEVRDLRNNYERTIYDVFGYLHENGYPMSQDFKYEKRIDNEKLVKEQLEYFCIRTANELKVPNYKFPEITINGKKFAAYSTRAVMYEQNWKPKNVLYYMAKQADKFTFEGENTDRIMEILEQLEKVNKDMVVTECMYGDGGLEKYAVHDIFIREKLDQRYVLESELIHLLTGKVQGIETLETDAMKAAVERAEEKKNALNKKEKPEEKKADNKEGEKNQEKKEDKPKKANPDKPVKEKEAKKKEKISEGWTDLTEASVEVWTTEDTLRRNKLKNIDLNKIKKQHAKKVTFVKLGGNDPGIYRPGTKKIDNELADLTAKNIIAKKKDGYLEDGKLDLSRVAKALKTGLGDGLSNDEIIKLVRNLAPEERMKVEKDLKEEQANADFDEALKKYKDQIYKQYKRIEATYGKLLLQLHPQDLVCLLGEDAHLCSDFACIQDANILLDNAKDIFDENKKEDQEFIKLNKYYNDVYMNVLSVYGAEMQGIQNQLALNGGEQFFSDECIGDLNKHVEDVSKLEEGIGGPALSEEDHAKYIENLQKRAKKEDWEDRLYGKFKKTVKKPAKSAPKTVASGKNAKKPVTLKQNEEKNVTAKKNAEKPAALTAEEKAKQKAELKFEKEITAAVTAKGAGEKELATMRKNYGDKLLNIAALDKILGVKVRANENYDKQLTDVKKMISESRPEYEKNKKLIVKVLAQFAKLGATERTLDAKSADKGMVQKGIQACAAYIRYILKAEPVLPEDALYISQKFKPKNAVPVSDGNGNTIEMDKTINDTLHKDMIKKAPQISDNPERLLEREALAAEYGNIKKITDMTNNYNKKQAKEWKISIGSGTRDVIRVLMPLKGEKELPEEDIKKFALNQNIILKKEHAGKKGSEAKATGEEQLKAFRESLPIYKAAIEDIERYKNDFANKRYGEIFAKENKDLQLLQTIAGKAQAIGYFANNVLGNNVLVNGINDNESEELISIWNKAGAMERLFGAIKTEYGNLCRMTPNQLCSEGYKGSEKFGNYDQDLKELEESHKKRWNNAKNKVKREARNKNK